MRIFLFAILLLISNQTLHAQTYVAVKDLNAFKQSFMLASNAVNAIESDFVQVKHLSMLKDKITSKGKFYYKKENKVRIEYTSPYKYCMVINNKTMTVRDEQKTTNYNTKSNKMMQSINNIMLDCMKGTVYNNKEFSTQVMENAKEYLLQLTPTTTMMKKMFAKIEVYVDKKNYNVLGLNMVEQGGDNSLMTFTNHMLNKNLMDALFSLK